MTIQPECSAFDLRNSTPATAPSPSRTRIKVPTNSAIYGFTWYSFLEWAVRRHTVRRSKVPLLLGYPVRDVKRRSYKFFPALPFSKGSYRGGAPASSRIQSFDR